MAWARWDNEPGYECDIQALFVQEDPLVAFLHVREVPGSKYSGQRFELYDWEIDDFLEELKANGVTIPDYVYEDLETERKL